MDWHVALARYYKRIDCRSFSNSLPLEKRHRAAALNIVGKGNIQCVRCRCDRLELLEINHVHYDGKTDRQQGVRANGLFRAIVLGKRKHDDLEILCKPCNIIHYLDFKFGKLPYKIEWLNGKGTDNG